MFIVSAISFFVLGIAALLSVRVIHANSRRAANDTVTLTITIAGWLLIFLGFTVIVSPLGMMLAMIIFGMWVATYRNGERRALLWTLTMAAEKGLPLAPSARAFAMRRCDEMARRAWLLADLLEAGVPLPKALTDSGNPLPRDATLMVRLGHDSQSTAITLREAAEHGGKTDEAWRPVFLQTLYLLLVMAASAVIISFIMVRIIPTYRQIFMDFGTPLPLASRLMMQLAEGFVQFWYLVLPLVLYLLIVVLISGFFYAQGKIWIPPPFGWLYGRSENPAVLRGLAICVDQQVPIDQALAQLARHYPKLSLRDRLARSVGAVRGGADWCDSLRQEKIVTPAEAAVLRSAARAGNLSWALRELAEVGSRRLIYRAKTLLSIATPCCLLLLAVPVALLAVGCFIPLVSLVEAAADATY